MLSPINYFFIVFAGTILITRLVLLPQRVFYPKIHGQHIHHFVYGIILAIVSLFLGNIFLYGVGLGLFADEMPLMFTKKWTWGGYNSKLCRTEDIAIIFLVFILRNYILLPFKA